MNSSLLTRQKPTKGVSLTLVFVSVPIYILERILCLLMCMINHKGIIRIKNEDTIDYPTLSTYHEIYHKEANLSFSLLLEHCLSVCFYFPLLLESRCLDQLSKIKTMEPLFEITVRKMETCPFS